MTTAKAHIGTRIEVEDLTCHFGTVKAVDGVSFTVEAGEFLTLLGSSGSGKSTTLMMIAGFVDPTRGSIRIGGQDVSSLPPEKRDIGVVFQSYALFPHMNVFDNVAFPLKMRRMPKDEIERRVLRTLELVELHSRLDSRITQLSGGQQQRIALARALVFEPPVLLMDEPMGALDRRLREQLEREVKTIQRELGLTVIYVTHDQEEALLMSDRIAIMAEGRIEQIDTPQRIYEAPQSPFVAAFLGESNFLTVRRSVSGDYEPGDGPGAAKAMVRPEDMRLLGSGETAALMLSGQVESIEFPGGPMRLGILTPAGKMDLRLHRHQAREVGLGDEVRLGWAPTSMVVFPEGE